MLILSADVNPKAKEHQKELEAAGSPLHEQLDDNLLIAFSTGRPLDKPNIRQCKHCKRPVLEHVAVAHIRKCLQKNEEKKNRKKE